MNYGCHQPSFLLLHLQGPHGAREHVNAQGSPLGVAREKPKSLEALEELTKSPCGQGVKNGEGSEQKWI